jgi:trigger factor
MKFTVEEVSSVERKLTVEVSAEERQEAHRQVLKKTSRTARLKGFRPGKVPEALVESHYASEINVETMEKLLDRYYPEAVKESGLRPLNRPQLDITSMSENFTFTAQFEIAPAFTLEPSAYLGLELQAPGLIADQKAVDDAIEHIRDQHAQWVPVEEKRPSVSGDMVVADYQMFDLNNGEPLTDKAFDAELKLEDTLLLAPIAAALTGVEAGQRLEPEMEFDQEAANPKLRGKKVRFAMEVKGLKRKELPDLDLEFVQNLWPEMESVAQFRETVESDLRDRFQRQNERDLRRQIVDKVSALADFELPPSLVRDQQEQMLKQLKDYMEDDKTAPLPGFDDDALREEMKESAAKKVKAGFILTRIAEMENIKLEEKDLDQELARLSGSSDTDALKRNLIGSNALLNFSDRVLENKILQHLQETAKIIKDEDSPA